MLRKNLLKIFLLYLIFTFFSTCDKSIELGVSPQRLTEVPIRYLWEAIEENRFVEAKSEEEIQAYIQNLIAGSENKAFPDGYVQPPTQDNYDRGRLLTKEELLEDIEYFFNLMEYGYAGYVFYDAQQWQDSKVQITNDALQTLKTEPTFAAGRLENIFQQYLTFINDAHFTIGNKRLNTQYLAHMNNDLAVYHENNEFVFYEAEKKFTIKSIEGAEPKEYLRLSLDDEGRLVYKLFVLRQPGGDVTVRMIYVNVDNLHNEQEKLVRLRSFEFDQYESIAYKQEEINGIPVITSRRFWEQQPGELEAFVESYSSLRDKDVAILDIRGNPGGASIFASEWMSKYLGEHSNWSVVSIDRRTDITMQLSRVFYVNTDVETQQIEAFVNRFSASPEGWGRLNIFFPKKFENHRYLVVLMDNGVASSGEAFIDKLKQIDNVILIGSNSRGVVSVGNNFQFSLLNSIIPFSFGTSLIFPLDLQNIEGKGFVPDIWVEPGKELELALKFIENYLLLQNLRGLDSLRQ
ncbi:S41 family peptidase [Spirochaeta dissipatitropha]